MQLAMYTQETSHWYALLNKAQAMSKCYFLPEVEDYLVYVLACMSSDADDIPERALSSTDYLPSQKRKQRLMELRQIGEQSMVVAGLFPDHATRTGIPLLYLMDRGRSAYLKLSSALPDDSVYAYIGKNFTEIVDVLHELAQICGDKHPVDLIQACELWQETGSRHSWSVIKNNIGSFPIATASDLQH